MKVALILLFCFIYSIHAVLHQDTNVIMSKRYENLPWPLLNPHSLEFLTTHALHCYYANEMTLEKAKRAPLNFMDRLHTMHCLEELIEVHDYLRAHPNFHVDKSMCPQITGQGKNWMHHLGSHHIDYYSDKYNRISLREYLQKDPMFSVVYKNLSTSDPLYVEYSHDSGTENQTSTIIKSFNQQYISAQDTEMRMIAGFNYGLILMKQLAKLDLTPEEALYIKEQNKSDSEKAWSSASFYCTFFEDSMTVIQKMAHQVRQVIPN